MIDENIIKNFTSNYDREASFSVIITGMEQEHKCNKDVLKIQTQYIDPNVFTIIKNQQDIIDDIRAANDIVRVKKLIQDYDSMATEVSQVIGRELVIQSDMDFDKAENLFKTQLNAYQNTIEGEVLKTDVSGTIINGVAKVTSPDFPSKITFNDIRITKNTVTIKVPGNIKNITLIIDNTEYPGEMVNNVFTATVNNIMEGSHIFEIKYDLDSDIITKNIEMVVTPIDKTIDITFQKQYIQIPFVHVTIDEKYSSLYSNYTTNFKGKYVCQHCGHIYNGINPPAACPSCQTTVFNLESYNGVLLTFKNLKRRAKYPNINVTIIGGHYNE